MELWIFGIMAAILAIIVIVYYNKIVSGKNAIVRAWSDVIVQERQKLKVIPELERIVEDHKAFESGLLEKLVGLRSAVNQLTTDKVDHEAVKKADMATKDVLSGIQVTMEAYPDLKTAGLMNKLMVEIVEQQDNVAAAIRIFNQNVEGFNNSIETFPGSMINSALNKQNRQRSFDDADAAQGFEFKPGDE